MGRLDLTGILAFPIMMIFLALTWPVIAVLVTLYSWWWLAAIPFTPWIGWTIGMAFEEERFPWQK